MPIVNRIAEFAADMKTWRRHLHANPELGFDCHNTAAFVQERLAEFGVDEVHPGIATTGIVALIHGQGDGPVIGLRADMDALPLQETTGADHTSQIDGKMHACGHDGHTTMLLGAARYLAETRNFAGTVALVFQPAEENGGGGGVMVEEGVLDRFNISQMYALHTLPGAEAGHFLTTPGPIMASVDSFEINITGAGGHGAYPHETVDPIPAALHVAQAIQTIVSRNNNTADELVVSVTQIHTGTAENIVPETAFLGGTIRSFDAKVAGMVRERMQSICDGAGVMFGLDCQLDYIESYPATINDAAKVDFAAGIATQVAGDDRVIKDYGKEMGAEDFSYFLEKRPGAFLYLGQGDGPPVHNPGFDFNDDVAPVGASFFALLVEAAQPVER